MKYETSSQLIFLPGRKYVNHITVNMKYHKNDLNEWHALPHALLSYVNSQ